MACVVNVEQYGSDDGYQRCVEDSCIACMLWQREEQKLQSFFAIIAGVWMESEKEGQDEGGRPTGSYNPAMRLSPEVARCRWTRRRG